MVMSRRDALTTLAGVGLVAGAAACSNREENEAAGAAMTATAADTSVTLPGLPKDLLVNRARAQRLMADQGIGALICSDPVNIYYLTNYSPLLSKMGIHGMSYAILPADPLAKPILVCGQFIFYLAGTERTNTDLIDVRLFTSPAEEAQVFANQHLLKQLETEGYPGFLPVLHDAHDLPDHQASRRETAGRYLEEVHATAEAALVSAAKDLGLNGMRVAVDQKRTADLLEAAELPVVYRDGHRLLQAIRLQKTDTELELARFAANQNALAGREMARAVRDGASFAEMRQTYAMACATRGLTPTFLVIDGVVPETAPGTVQEGRSFLIDCVSEHQGYHGDYGRTICVGEPTAQMKKATDALSNVWDELLPQLKPGLRYSQIQTLASEAFKKNPSDAALLCNPHSVGLRHTDEPGREGVAHWLKDDLELVENMVLSVDLPMIESGLGGTAHLEDLVLITKDGAELLNDGGDHVIIV